MKQSQRKQRVQALIGVTVGLTLAVIGINTGQAYSTYSEGCQATGCHGDFRGTTSPKGTVFSGSPANNHNMHRNVMSISAGDASCVLCHTNPDEATVYIGSSDGVPGTLNGMGCSGCHVGSGLRKHHQTKGAAGCYTGGCHGGNPSSDNPPAENVISPYYYGKTAYTRVQNPSNTLQVANTNENWSVGDFWGVDNDGNGLADLADYTIGPRESILSAVQEGNNVRVTWQTAGGRTNTIQAAGNVSGTYTTISPAILRTNAGLFTTNYVEVGGANSAARFYRTKVQ